MSQSTLLKSAGKSLAVYLSTIVAVKADLFVSWLATLWLGTSPYIQVQVESLQNFGVPKLQEGGCGAGACLFRSADQFRPEASGKELSEIKDLGDYP